jgi:hypothetical protein
VWANVHLASPFPFYSPTLQLRNSTSFSDNGNYIRCGSHAEDFQNPNVANRDCATADVTHDPTTSFGPTEADVPDIQPLWKRQ